MEANFLVNQLPNEVWVLILHALGDTTLQNYDILPYASVSKNFSFLIFQSITSLSKLFIDLVNFDDSRPAQRKLTSLTIDDQFIQRFVNLTDFKFYYFPSNSKIQMTVTDIGLKSLRNLTYLDTGLGDRNFVNITNEGIKELKLVMLDVSGINNKITNEGITHLTSLTSLHLNSNQLIGDEGIKNLTKLKSLYLRNNDMVTNCGLKHLTNLTMLDLYRNKGITDEGISHLINLNDLDILNTSLISDKGIQGLTNITQLAVNELITFEGIKNMNAMTSLDLSYNDNIQDDPKVQEKFSDKIYNLYEIFC